MEEVNNNRLDSIAENFDTEEDEIEIEKVGNLTDYFEGYKTRGEKAFKALSDVYSLHEGVELFTYNNKNNS